MAITVRAADLAEPIQIAAPELAKVNFDRTDGGLAPVPGLQTFVVFRANHEHPELADGRGWTYDHHPDLACWQGRLYVGWDSCEKDEDTWPSRELYSTSVDGRTWTPAAELFPQGISTALRMYFFHAPNGRMLVIAGLRVSHDKLNERTKGGLVVREIKADHSLGEVFALRPALKTVPGQPADFEMAPDAGFVTACRQLLANHPFLQQQDYGVLLDPASRMKWNDPSTWTGPDATKAPDFGKAMCFFHRLDGTLVGVCKKGWVTLSKDEGVTWSQPVQPPSLITGMGKVWGQRTPDGHYILVYNPDAKRRWPMALLTSDDGIHFHDARVIHGELPPLRYSGGAKNSGASYIRGISEWSSDGSRPDDAIWLVYSVNKEEIWVSRILVNSIGGKN